MKTEKEIRERFKGMKNRVVLGGDEDDVEALYWGDALAWVLSVKAPEYRASTSS